jgi:phosphate transport system substrate-binding protein
MPVPVLLTASLAGPALGIMLAFASQASAQALTLGGTGGAMGMAERLGAAYAAADGPQVEIIPSLGSSGAISAVADGAIDLAISSRPLRTAESARGLVAIPIARTPLVFATSRQESSTLGSADISAIFASVDPKWPDGAELRIVLRPASDTDLPILADYFPGFAEAVESARQRYEIPVAATDQDNAALAEELPGSLVHAGLSQLLTERRNLRTVARSTTLSPHSRTSRAVPIRTRSSSTSSMPHRRPKLPRRCSASCARRRARLYCVRPGCLPDAQ